MRKFSFFIAIFFIALVGKITAQTPATLPYSCDFNDATERSNWTLRNTTNNMLAQWFFQYHSYDEEDYSLSCGDGSDWIYQPDDASVTVYALRKFNCGDADSIKISFTYRVEGEGFHNDGDAYDYITALCVKEDAGFQAKELSDIETLGYSDEYKSYMLFNHADGIPATHSDSVNACKLSMKNGTFTTTIKNPNPNGTATLIFAWKNDDSETTSGNNRAGWIDDISISPITPIEDYGITIAGVKVTSDNCNNITGAKISGSVSYNDESKTLTLDNATIEGRIDFGTGASRIADITITLVGENAMTGHLGSVRGTKTINGTGSLKVVGELQCDSEKTTIIENCTIDIDYNGNGALFSGNGDGSKLTIKNANISAEAMLTAIGDFKDIELIGCEIVEPANAQIIDNEVEVHGIKFAGKYICDADGNVAKKVVIKKIDAIDYGIKVAEVKVTADNCNNITGEGISGSVSYNPETKTLTLDNTTIKGYIEVAKDLTINLQGENKIEAYHGGIASVDSADLIITSSSDGTLNMTGYLFVNRGRNLLIKDCNINITSPTSGSNDYGITGNGEANQHLTIDGANIEITTYSNPAIADFASVTFKNVDVVEPQNYQIDDFYDMPSCILNEDGTAATHVVIKKKDSGIEKIANNTNEINIYPNPAHNNITVEGKGEIKITNSIGQVVKEIKDNSTYRTLNIKDFERGVYYIKVGEKTQKLVVE